MINLNFLNKIQEILETKTLPKKIIVNPPSELHFELTYKCNAKCIMCNLRYLDNSIDLSYEDIRKLIINSKLLKNINLIILSGGEPWLNKDFTKILDYLINVFPKSNFLILSNMLDENILNLNLQYIKKNGYLKKIFLGTSLDGIDSAHDKIRSYKNSFKKLLNSIELIKNNFPELNFSFNFTLTPYNYDQLLPTYEWTKKNNHNISYQVVVQKKETKKFRWEKIMINVIEQQIKYIIYDILNSNNTTNIKDLIFKPWLLSKILNLYYIPKYISNPKRYLPNCPVGTKFVMINPKGEIYLCPVHKNKIIGNIKKENFDTLWTSEKASKLHTFFDKKKCHCWLSCTNNSMIGDALEQNLKNILNIFFNNSTF